MFTLIIKLKQNKIAGSKACSSCSFYISAVQIFYSLLSTWDMKQVSLRTFAAGIRYVSYKHGKIRLITFETIRSLSKIDHVRGLVREPV